jgi:hypothetical protein
MTWVTTKPGGTIHKDWNEGSKLVSKVSYIKKKNCDGYYTFYAAIDLKPSTITSRDDDDNLLEGTLSFEDYDDVDIFLYVQYPLAEDDEFTEDLQIFDFEELGEDSSYVFTLPTGKARFTVNTTGQRDLLISMDMDFDSAVSNKYPDANLDFFHGNGASFNRTGTMELISSATAVMCMRSEAGSFTRSTPTVPAIRLPSKRGRSVTMSFPIPNWTRLLIRLRPHHNDHDHNHSHDDRQLGAERRHRNLRGADGHRPQLG